MNVERRNGKRYDARFGVVFSDTSGLNFSFITNLSRTGLFLSSKQRFSIGSRVRMHVSNGRFEAPLEGRIVRINHDAGEHEMVGLGLEFDRLSPSAKRLRDDLLLYLMNLKYHSDWH